MFSFHMLLDIKNKKHKVFIKEKKFYNKYNKNNFLLLQFCGPSFFFASQYTVIIGCATLSLDTSIARVSMLCAHLGN